MLLQLWINGAVVCFIVICRTTALPQTSKTLSVDDVRRPVYRGNHRYRHSLQNFYLKENTEGNAGNNNIFKLLFDELSNIKKIIYGEQHFSNKPLDTKAIQNRIADSRGRSSQNVNQRKEHKLLNTSGSDDSWTLVELPKNSNQTRIVEKFSENSLYDSEKSDENFDKLMVSHTDTANKHIQAYPTSSSSWIERPLQPGVILVEDVHPSKLPKPPEYSEVPLYPNPTKPSIYVDHKPSVSKPSTVYGHPVVTRPSIDYSISKPIVSKPIYHYPEVDSTKPKPVNNPIYLNTISVKPVSHVPQSVYNPMLTTHKPSSVTVTNILTHYTPVYTKPPPEPPPKAPPPTIVVIDSPLNNYIDCGNVQVLNSAAFKHCPDVTVVLNANQNISATSLAGDSVVPSNTATTSPISPANGVVPLVPSSIVSGQKPTIIIPVNEEEEEEEEEYDYEEEDELASDEVTPNTTAAPVKPHKPSTSNSLFSYLQNFVTSLPFIGPVSVSLWVIFLGPLSFLFLGAMGVASFIFPWIAPRLAFGRSREQLFASTDEINHSANMFMRNLRTGTFKKKNWTRESKSDVPETVPSTTATPIGESLRAVTKQLLQPTDMVATDVRTPPRVKNKTGEAKVEKLAGHTKSDRIGEGIGEAIPIDNVTQVPGLSTWILLSSDQAKGRPATQATIQSVEKPVKKNDTLKIKPAPNKIPLKKLNSSEEDAISPLILQDVKFKNRTPVVVGRVPTTPLDNQTKSASTTVAKSTTTIATPENKTKLPSIPTQPTKVFEIVPTTSLVLETDTIDTGDETSTIESTTTKRTRRPSIKKRKKNKNKRRRPSKPEEAAESKITQDTNLVSNKIEGNPNRPLSTRIYNYLAREVMPTVGVGIVGLVLTAGLAGLFLYPFGGGIARRNYEKDPSHQQHYFYNDYAPHREDHKPTEKKIFNPMSAPHNHNSYLSSYDPKFENKFRYENNYGQPVNGYAGNNEYSTLPDSVKNSDFSLTDNNKYYSMDPVSSQYKLTDTDKFKDDGNYPSFTEYTSYTNAASIGTRGSYENVDINLNDTKEEDKSDKSQPEFSALVSTPQFTNTDFVGSVSLTGSYGTDAQRTGALASEHGPRSLRNTRDVHDDFNNEIDVTDEKILKLAPVTQSTESQKSEITTDSKTTVNEFSTEFQNFEHETTTQFNLMNIFSEENVKDPQDFPVDNSGGIIGFIKKLAQLKLKIGISLLRSTSEAVQKYFDNVATRMEEAVRHLEKRRSLIFSSPKVKRDITRSDRKK